MLHEKTLEDFYEEFDVKPSGRGVQRGAFAGKMATKIFAHARCSLCGVRVGRDAGECPYCGARLT